MATSSSSIAEIVRGLDRWFESMRVDWPTPGYGSPVVHWWQHSLTYQGSGLDWRYEGIIAGYLNLWQKTGAAEWLEKACRAGHDLTDGQLQNGHFANSRFEMNPGEGGTPHEAAVCYALLLLANERRTTDPVASQRFLDAAIRNLESYWFGQLWHEPSATLWDNPRMPSFVPNKAATFLDAVLMLSQITGDTTLIERYALPTGDRILAMQACHPGDLLDGAIAQNRFGDRVVWSYFPLYVARCVPPLLHLFDVTVETRFRDGALAAARFVERVREPDGGSPQVLYPRGRRNRHPRWIAGSGDTLRALLTANAHGAEFNLQPTINWLVRGSRADGHIATASGFGKIAPLRSRKDQHLDEVGVVGWCDKAFRALSEIVEPAHLRSASPPAATVGVGGVA